MTYQISLETVVGKRTEFFSNGQPVEESMRLFLNWLGENESNLDEDARQYLENFLKNLFMTAENSVHQKPDSPEKRKTLRTIATNLDKHVKAENLLGGIERSPPEQDQTSKDWSETILCSHQAILDLLFDLTSSSSGIKYSAVFLTLFYGIVDELTAAHHLARHHYYVQANNHLRTVLETIDRIELFIKQPEWIQVWAGNDKKRIHNEFKPSAVRKKLGKDSFDPLYGYLSETGTHPTFQMFKGRSVREVGENSRTARVFVAGTPLEHLRAFHCVLSLVVANMVLGKIVDLFRAHLNVEECMNEMSMLARKVMFFSEKHFIPWAVENKMDATELLQIYQSFIEPEEIRSREK